LDIAALWMLRSSRNMTGSTRIFFDTTLVRAFALAKIAEALILLEQSRITAQACNQSLLPPQN